MRRIILGLITVAVIAWMAWPGGVAAWMHPDVRLLVLPVLATIVAAMLLARYFDWRGNLRRRIAAEWWHPARGATDRDRERFDQAA